MKLEGVILDERNGLGGGVRFVAGSLDEGELLFGLHMYLCEEFDSSNYEISYKDYILICTGRAMGPKDAYIEFGIINLGGFKNN